MSLDGQKYILVVDDSDTIKEYIRNFFRGSDYQVITSADGMEGIESAIKYKPGLILLDLMMPNLDGLKMLKVINMIEDTKDIPVIVITANSSRSNVISAVEAGAGKVLSKPISEVVLFDAVREILGDFRNNGDNLPVPVFREEFNNAIKDAFYNSFPAKKYGIIEALGNRNKSLLKQVVHELKGAGSTVGLDEVTLICRDIEAELSLFRVDWGNVKKMCEQIFEIVRKTEK